MLHTNSAATSLPRTASAAPMLHQKSRGKMGEWKAKSKLDVFFFNCESQYVVQTLGSVKTNPSNFLTSIFQWFFLFFRVTFCAEHARRNAMALRAQMRKASAGPSPESLLSQLSGYNRAETHSIDGSRSEASRILGKRSHSDHEILC